MDMKEAPDSNVVEFPEQPRQKQGENFNLSTEVRVLAYDDERGEMVFKMQDGLSGLDIAMDAEFAVGALAIFVAAIRGITDLYHSYVEDDEPPNAPIMAVVTNGEARA